MQLRLEPLTAEYNEVISHDKFFQNTGLGYSQRLLQRLAKVRWDFWGLTMQEIKAKGEVVIRADVLDKRHILSERQTKAMQYILQYGELTIKKFAELCVDTPRRSLQRDLKNLVDKGLVRAEGATNQLIYKLTP